MAGAVLNSVTGDLLEYHHLMQHPTYKEVYGKAFDKEVDQLAQGLPGVVEGTDTISFVEMKDIP